MIRKNRTIGLALSLALIGVMLGACSSQDEGPSSSVTLASNSSGAPMAAEEGGESSATPDPYYLELLQEKAELVGLVEERAALYREGNASSLNPNHHADWPENFPPAPELPAIEGQTDFAIRQTGEASEALGGIYLAVPVGEQCELRMDVSRSQNADGVLTWGSGNTWFSQAGDPDWDNWVLTDVER